MSLCRRTCSTLAVMMLALLASAAPAVAVPGSGSVSGMVVNSAAEPIEGVFVSVFDADTFDFVGSTETTASGGFLVSELPAGSFELFIDDLDYDPTSVPFDLSVGQALDIGSIVLEAPDPTVTGRVSGPGGIGISDASVEAFSYDPAAREWMLVDFTSTTGTGSWGMPLSAGTYRFGFDAWQFKREYFNDRATLTGATNVTIAADTVRSNVNAVLAPSVASISGSVVDSAGVPVAGIGVGLVAGDGLALVDAAWTGVDGDYTFLDVPQGTYLVKSGGTDNSADDGSAYREQYYDRSDTATFATAVDVTSESATGGIDFALTDAEVTISGTVRDVDSGIPVGGVAIDLFSVDSSGITEWLTRTWTGDEGAYSFYDLPSAKYFAGHVGDVPVVDPITESVMWYRPCFWDSAESTSAAVKIVAGGGATRTDIDLNLVPAPPAITGTVTAQGTGTPIEGVSVVALSDVDGEVLETGWAMTDPAGHYAMFGVPPGDHRIAAGGWQTTEDSGCWATSFFDGAPDYAAADPVSVTAGSRRDGVDFELVPCAPMASGRTVDTAGAGVPDAAILVEQRQVDPESGEMSWELVGVGFSGADGSFDVLPLGTLVPVQGSVRISIDAGPDYFVEWYDGQRIESRATPVTLVAGVTKDLGTIRLEDYVAAATRVAADTRYTTAAGIADRFTQGFSDTDHVIIASGEDRASADPLAAAGLVWAYDGAPILLVSSTDVPSAVEVAIKRVVALNDRVTIHIVGGTRSIPEARRVEIVRMLGASASKVSFDRINGRNRYDNGRLIAARMKAVRPDMPDYALAANGADATKFFDALALSSITAHTGAPIMLVSQTAVPAETAAALKTLGLTADSVWVAGGTKTVDARVVRMLGSSEARRLAGANRYSTAIAVSEHAIRKGWLEPTSVGVAAKLPDALTGGAAVGHRGGSLVLTTSDRLWPETGAYLMSLAPTLDPGDGLPAEVYVFGGTRSVSAAVIREIDEVLAGF